MTRRMHDSPMRIPYLPSDLPYAPAHTGCGAARTTLAPIASVVRAGAPTGEQTVGTAHGQPTPSLTASGYSATGTIGNDRCQSFAKVSLMSNTESYLRSGIAYAHTSTHAGFGFVSALALALAEEADNETDGLTVVEVLALATQMASATDMVVHGKAGFRLQAYYPKAARAALAKCAELVAAARKTDDPVKTLALSLAGRFGTLRVMNGAKSGKAARKPAPETAVYRALNKIKAVESINKIVAFATLKAAMLGGDKTAEKQIDDLLKAPSNPRIAALQAALASAAPDAMPSAPAPRTGTHG